MLSPAPEDIGEDLAALVEEMTDNIPEQIRKMFSEVARLDRECAELRKAIYNKQLNYMANCSKLTSEQKLRSFTLIQKEMTDAADLCDKKLALCAEAKANWAEFYEKFRFLEGRFIENVESPSKPARVEPLKNDEPVEPEETEEEEPPKDRRRKKKAPKKKDEEEEEERFCWCQMLKDDEMVMCDNGSCQFQWFHFTCIGMKSAPSGEWYCGDVCRRLAGADENGKKDEKHVGRKRKRN